MAHKDRQLKDGTAGPEIVGVALDPERESDDRSFVKTRPTNKAKIAWTDAVLRMNLHLDQRHHRAEIGGKCTDLTSTEFEVLRALTSRGDSAVAHMEIQMRVCSGVKSGTKGVEVHVSNLRKKMKSLGLDIVFVCGEGYKLRSCRVVDVRQRDREIAAV